MQHIKINFASLGLLLMSIYIFMSYNAVDIVLPSILSSIALYLFLAFSVFFILINIKSNKTKISAYSTWYVIFLIISMLTMIYSPEQNLLSGEFYLMIVAFVLTFFIQVFIRSERSFALMCWVYSISSTALILTLIATGNMIADTGNRLGGDFMGNANTFACSVMVAVMYTIWLLIYQKNKFVTKILLFGMIILDYYALILSAGRKFFVLPFVFLYVLLLFKADKKGRKHIILYTLLVGAIVAAAMFLIMKVPLFYNTIGYRMESYINGIRGLEEHGTSAAIRKEMQQIALKKWPERPLFGHGFDSFKYYCATVTGHFFYSHCNYTELLYNGGIICFLIYYFVYWIILKNALILKKGQQKYRAFAIGIALSFLVFDYGAVSYSLSVIQIMLAMSLQVLKIQDKKQNALE